MWYILIALVIVVGIAFGIKEKSKSISTQSINNQNIKNSLNFPQDTVTLLYSKKEIVKMLEVVSKTKPPENLSFGAMCYDIAGPPETANYICPSCGSKTVYKRDSEIGTSTIQWTIPSCRSAVKNIKGVNIALDESSFCKKCSPNVENPELCLLVNINNEQDTNKVCNIRESDLVLLKEFLDGDAIHKGAQDQETPLKDHLERIEELLGVKH